MGNKINKALKNIFKYNDYRQFLKDFFTEQKRIKKQFSHRYLAQKSGFSSPSFFINIIKGERNLSKKSLEKLLDGLSIEGKERKFLRYLVLYNQAKSVEEKELYYKELENIRKHTNYFKINSKQFAYFKKWYYPVIRELVVLYDWQKDYTKLAQMVTPAITVKQAKEAVQTLLDIGMIKKTDNGYKQTNKLITIESVPIFVKKDLRKNVLLKGIESLDNFSPDERYTSFYTVAISEKTYKDITNLLDEIGNRIMNESLNEDEAEKIYNIAFQIYPVSNKFKKD